MADIDVIIVAWNDRENLVAALDSIFALPELHDDPTLAQVTISDNGSSDGTLAMLHERYADRVRVVENCANLGFGAGVNRALALSDSPYVFLLNPDAGVKAGCLRELLAFMQSRPKCALAGPKIYEADGSIAESCGEFDTWVGAFLRSSAWGEFAPFARYANGARLRSWNYDTQRQVDLVIGAALLLRRSALETIGSFDERYFMYHEEVDLAKRAADAGYESWFIPQAQATHIGQGSSRGKSVERMKQQSRRKYWIKHHGHLWYYSLSAALAGRYILYAAVLCGIVVVARRLLRH
ncbi:MAG: glycosyltransferase family 2 protein [Candidatus Eremiobacteraeota bacterium]|nr:glycosyltransferase family 2 protein [Candidatus Eremiobacteraeota bacterium]